MDNHLIYDGDCPFCSAFVRMKRLQEAAGPVRLVNAREGGAEVARARQLGYDLDEGMLLHLDGRDYHGADCLRQVEMLSTGSGLFNRASALMFRRPAVARAVYPVMKAGRALTLRLLGRTRLGRDGDGA
jgi:predicted DCC family thiol-disulfide oxidoreductase YuxK